jgi:glucose-6-phosphate 1-dehydrogenase
MDRRLAKRDRRQVARLTIDSWRWAGVPRYLGSGQYLAEIEIVVELKPPPQGLFADSQLAAGRGDYFRFRLSPNAAIALAARVKAPRR